MEVYTDEDLDSVGHNHDRDDADRDHQVRPRTRVTLGERPGTLEITTDPVHPDSVDDHRDARQNKRDNELLNVAKIKARHR